MPRKIIVEVQDRNPFGDVDEKTMNRIMEDPSYSASYVKGYSDKRTQRDIALREGHRPETLPFRLQWARAKTLDGRDDIRRVNHWKQRGYTKLTWAEAEAKGLDLANSGAVQKGEDGLIYYGENVLMICDADRAAYNYKKQRQATEEQAESAQARVEAAGERLAAATGLNAGVFTMVEDVQGNPISKKSKK